MSDDDTNRGRINNIESVIKMFLVMYNDWDDSHALGIFSTRDLAVEFINTKIHISKREPISISEYTLDQPEDIDPLTTY